MERFSGTLRVQKAGRDFWGITIMERLQCAQLWKSKFINIKSPPCSPLFTVRFCGLHAKNQ